MKFGKTYMETMADPSFPEEWRNGALEYKHLKKLINGVVAELESIGLGADVLRELLVRPEEEDKVASASSPTSKTKPLPTQTDDLDSAVADDSGNSSEQDDEDQPAKELTPAGKWISDFSVDMIRRVSATSADGEEKEALASKASRDTSSTGQNGSSKSPTRSNNLAVPNSPSSAATVKESSCSARRSMIPTWTQPRVAELPSTQDQFQTPANGQGSAARIWLRCDRVSTRPSPTFITQSLAHMIQAQEVTIGVPASGGKKQARLGSQHQYCSERSSATSSAAAVRKERSTSPAKHRWVEGKYGRRARAEYELGGTPDHPVPRIRLYIESPLPSDDEGDDEPDIEDVDEGSLSDDTSSRKSLEERIIELPATPTRRFSTIQKMVLKARRESRKQNVKVRSVGNAEPDLVKSSSPSPPTPSSSTPSPTRCRTSPTSRRTNEKTLSSRPNRSARPSHVPLALCNQE